MGMTVMVPGLLTTVQDFGRIGYQHVGMPVSGVMDPWAMAMGNILVGNDANEAVLECTVMGPQLRFEESNIIAVVGGDLGAVVNGLEIPMYRAICIKRGQVLAFTRAKKGCRAFIAVSGGIEIELIMGSRSTYLKGAVGGYKGRKLQAGDTLEFRNPQTTLKNLAGRAVIPQFMPGNEYSIRVIMGPQDDLFAQEGIDRFLNSEYKVSVEHDRMGCRMTGLEIEHLASGDIISDTVTFGSIQVPSGGQPIIMLSDRQTTGGYAKIAHVIAADFQILAQLKAGDRVRFQKVSVNHARKEMLLAAAVLNKIKEIMEG